jgi:hypothetical protein
MLCGVVPMELNVTAVDDDYIHCGDWKFDKKTGVEIDEDLGWGPDASGSHLVPKSISRPEAGKKSDA